MIFLSDVYQHPGILLQVPVTPEQWEVFKKDIFFLGAGIVQSV
jgi:hypothetical protein